jgi:hypothetical protein
METLVLAFHCLNFFFNRWLKKEEKDDLTGYKAGLYPVKSSFWVMVSISRFL